MAVRAAPEASARAPLRGTRGARRAGSPPVSSATPSGPAAEAPAAASAIRRRRSRRPSRASEAVAARSRPPAPARPRPGAHARAAARARRRRSQDAPSAALLPAPAVDPGMIAGEEHVGHRPAPVVRRPGEVRVLEAALELGREALEPRPSPPRAPRGADGQRRRGAPSRAAPRPTARTGRSRSRRCRDASRSARRTPRSARTGARPRAPRPAPPRPPWSSWRPCGVNATIRPGRSSPYAASSAASTTSTRSTIPAPPPYGSSSTWPARSGVVSR